MATIIKLHFLKNFTNNKTCDPYNVNSLQRMRDRLVKMKDNKYQMPIIDVKHCFVIN